MKIILTNVLLLALWLPLSAQTPPDKQALNEELLVAARKSNVEQVKALLAKGADVDAKSPYGATPLFFACDRANDVVVKILLEKGASPNVQDTFYKATPLGWASGKKNPEVIRLLVEYGAKETDMAMNYAIDGKHTALAKTSKFSKPPEPKKSLPLKSAPTNSKCMKARSRAKTSRLSLTLRTAS
jgi:hypothetical protein